MNTDEEMLMSYIHISDAPNGEIYAAIGDVIADSWYDDDWYYYDNYDDEDETSSASPALWGIGGMIVGALIMGLVFLYLRKRSRLSQPVMPVDPDGDEWNRRAASMGTAQRNTYTNPAAMVKGAAEATLSDRTAVTARSVEVYSADSVPGETMEELTVRVQGCLRRVGVGVELKDAAKILASYASDSCVRLCDPDSSDPSLLKKAANALSEFFCVSMPGSAEPAADYLPADDTVPAHVRVEIKLNRLDRADWATYGGIGRVTFCGLLRETEEQFFLPEEEWKRIDTLLSHYTGGWFSPARHQTIRSIENITTCLLAIGVDQDEVLDYALHKALFLRIHTKIGKSGMAVMSEAFEELFRGREMPLCRNFLGIYRPHEEKTEPEAEDWSDYEPYIDENEPEADNNTDFTPITEETESAEAADADDMPEIMNQTNHGGEYESL